MPNYFTQLQTINRLTKIKGTGTPKQLARRLEISERTVFRLIDLMRSLGAPIAYSKSRCSYYYEEDGSLEIAFKLIRKENEFS